MSNEVKLSARELRNAFDDLFERVWQQQGFFDVEDKESEIVTPFEEQFVCLVSQCSEDVVKCALLMTLPSESIEDNSHGGQLPTHLACDNDAPIEVMRWLLENDANKISMLQPDKWGI